MFSEKVTLVNPQGFHMRPASLLVGMVGKYDATVTIVNGDKEIREARRVGDVTVIEGDANSYPAPLQTIS